MSRAPSDSNRPGGLNITVYQGEMVRIEHGGEDLIVYINKRNGNQCGIVFSGPKSFVVKRVELDEKKDPQAT